MRWLLAVVALGGLSSVAHAAPCGGELLAHAAKAEWGVDVTPVFTCRQIRGKRAMRLVEAHRPDDPTPGWAAIVGRDEAILWSRVSYAGTPGQTITYSIVDLAGDGIDEIIAHEIYEGHMGNGGAALHVYALHGDVIEEAGVLYLAESGGRFSGANGCNATWALVGGRGKRARVQITATRDKDRKLEPAPDTCPLEGVHRYRWTGEAFALAD